MNEKLLHRISQIIIEYAKENQVVAYNQISRELDGAISAIGLNEPLGEISYRCIVNGFPPLSAIVVNQMTRLPGEGFFTWVATKMGFPDLAHSKWNEFYEEQERAIFNYDDWDSFLEKAFPNQSKKAENTSQINMNEILNSKGYLKDEWTEYYILTVKDFNEERKNAPFRYHVLVLKNNEVIKQSVVEDEMKQQLLTPAKIKGIQLLLEHSSQVTSNIVTMAHYKADRPKSELWQKESVSVFEEHFNKERQQFLGNIVEEDIESEEAQEDAYYKDGKAVQYYGTRYERNPLNRAKAIEIHGVTCKACGFNFEHFYGERGKDFIEVHHIKPLFTIEKEIAMNPETDLVPVCSNCHRMIHRKRDDVLTIEQIKELLLGSESSRS